MLRPRSARGRRGVGAKCKRGSITVEVRQVVRDARTGDLISDSHVRHRSRLVDDKHLIKSHHALPLLVRRPGGLVVEVTDGTAAYNADHYRVSLFYDLAKTSVIRIAWAQAQWVAPTTAPPWR